MSMDNDLLEMRMIKENNFENLDFFENSSFEFYEDKSF
jgi:hypothetical protein